tara:strand:+ start:3474 stop:4112 length:639 start_codon:yes stop_codon:yes gene_type:complete
MHLILNKSKPPQTPFAPQWHYHLGYELISNINFKKIAKIILKKEKHILKKFPPSAKSSVDGYTGLGKKSITSRYEYINIFSWWPEAEIKKLKPIVLNFHSRFLKKLKIKGISDFDLKGWVNVMRKGERIKAHLHCVDHTAYLSGHICVQCEDTATYYINPVNQLNEPYTQKIPNKVGQIILFPTCVPHYTDTHLGDKERITIAFDFVPKTRL